MYYADGTDRDLAILFWLLFPLLLLLLLLLAVAVVAVVVYIFLNGVGAPLRTQS